MATRVRPKPKELYDQDFYVWTEVQAELLRERRFAALDIPNLIEEIEGLGDAKKSAVLSNASVIVEHLLKLQHSPSQEPRRGWADTILEHRDWLELELTPRLRQVLEDELPQVYALTSRRTERRLRLYDEDAAADALPATCPTRSTRSWATGGLNRRRGPSGVPPFRLRVSRSPRCSHAVARPRLRCPAGSPRLRPSLHPHAGTSVRPRPAPGHCRGDV